MLTCPAPARATRPHYKGQWSAPEDWGHTAIHLILAPGSDSDHSQILWWQSDHHHVSIPNIELNGGRFGWNPTYDACDFSNFTDLGLPTSGENIFCAGHTLLADGNILVSGGTEAGSENGITSQRVFDTLRGEWADPAPPDMKWQRWYPSSTELGDGRVLVTSGSRGQHMFLFGGRTTANALASDSLHRFLLAAQGTWDPSVHETATQSWPGSRAHATMVESHAGLAGSYLFGGEDDGGLKNGVWWIKVHGTPYQRSDDFFSSLQLTALGDNMPPTTRHTAVMQQDTMIVFGGRYLDENQQEHISGNVWAGWQDVDVYDWHWKKLDIASSMSPSARVDHAAAYDAEHSRMIVFGGATDTVGTLADSLVWTLNANAALGEATWDTVTITGTLRPGPRLGETLNYDTDAVAAGGVDPSMVMFGGDEGGQNYTNELWRLWLDSDGTAHWTLEPDTAAALPSARAGHSAVIQAGTRQVFIMGGDTAAGRDSFVYSVRLFDEDDSSNSPQWVRLTSWHESLSGQIGMIQSNVNFSRIPEIYDPATRTWDELDQAPLRENWYPFTFSMPGGKAFKAGPSDSSWMFDVANETWSRFPSTSSSGFIGGSAVALGTRVMKTGSGLSIGWGTPSVGTTKSINLSDSSPTWAASNDMLPRFNHNLVILPTGEVLVTGGTATVGNEQTDGQHQPEIWDPNAASGAGAWYGGTGADTLSRDPFLRDYHSTALLLPDGRVLSAGGNASTSDRRWANIYCPPYLFDSNGDLAPRPEVSGVTRYASYGSDIDVTTSEDDSILSVCLLRPGAVTHGFNQTQRYVPLEWSFETNPNRIVATAPADPDTAPPGDYLLFVLKQSPDTNVETGVPSIGQWVRLSSDNIRPAKRNLNPDLVSQTSIGIEWISPGDDSLTGTAQKYELRRSSVPITEANWQTRTVVPNDPTPQVSGSYHLLAVNNLSPCTPYYFALLTRDEANNYSAISDTVSVKTFCSGGGGLGESAQEVGTEEAGSQVTQGAGMATAQLADGEEIGGGSTAPAGEQVRIDPRRRSGASAGTGSAVHHMVVEFEVAGTGVSMTVKRTSDAVEGIAADEATGVLLQFPDGAGGWSTQGRLDPGLMDGLFGIRPLAEHCRYVCLGDFDLTYVPATAGVGEAHYALTSATHSQLGDVTGTVAADGVVAMADGDELDADYSVTGSGESDLAWFVVVQRNGTAASTAWRRPVRTVSPRLPLQFALHPNQPNPFHGATTIRFDLPVTTNVRLEVFDLLGRRIRTLANARFKAGYQSLDWDRRDSRGNLMRAGVFVARLRAGGFEASRKMVLVP